MDGAEKRAPSVFYRVVADHRDDPALQVIDVVRRWGTGFKVKSCVATHFHSMIYARQIGTSFHETAELAWAAYMKRLDRDIEYAEVELTKLLAVREKLRKERR